MSYGDLPVGVPAFVFWLMPDEDPKFEEWPHSDLLHAWQRGRCAMCAPGDYFESGLVMDHDHQTGLIRGLLCRGCNGVEGGDGGGAAFHAWRTGLNPAAILGLTEKYQHRSVGHEAMEQAQRVPTTKATRRKIADGVMFDPMDPVFDQIAAAMM